MISESDYSRPCCATVSPSPAPLSAWNLERPTFWLHSFRVLFSCRHRCPDPFAGGVVEECCSSAKKQRTLRAVSQLVIIVYVIYNQSAILAFVYFSFHMQICPWFTSEDQTRSFAARLSARPLSLASCWGRKEGRKVGRREGVCLLHCVCYRSHRFGEKHIKAQNER